MVPALQHRIQSLYSNHLLPAIRSAATPCFRLAVKLAASLRILPRNSASAGTYGERFLIVHLSSHIGDTVMLLPMIEALRAAHPAARFECVVETGAAPLLRLAPCLDHVYAIDLGFGPTSTPWLELQRTFAILVFYASKMRGALPTTCIVPRWGCGFRDLMLAYLTQAANRIGFAAEDFDRSQSPALYRNSLLTRSIHGACGLHDPAKFVFLLEKAGLIPQVDLTSIGSQPSSSLCHVAESVDWFELSRRLGIDPEAHFAVIAPGASAPRRIWPADRWVKVIDHLHGSGHTIVLLTGKQDAAVAHELYALLPQEQLRRTFLVAGCTNLPESSCLVSHAALFLGNDSGPGHLAGALGVPAVILFIAAEGADPNGPSSPERVRPMGEKIACCCPSHALPPCIGYCTADSAHCILSISVLDVIGAIAAVGQITDRVCA